VGPVQAELSRLIAELHAADMRHALVLDFINRSLVCPTGKQADRQDCGQCTPYNNACSSQPANVSTADGSNTSMSSRSTLNLLLLYRAVLVL
jgi:hypothetical protein